MSTSAAQAASAVRSAAVPMGTEHDWSPLQAWIGDAHYVLLGEASHGTYDFYAERARITRQLLAYGQFNAVAIEGDWPDANRVNRFVRGLGGDASAVEALGGFKRFPTWMWRNTVVQEFVEWLRDFNSARPADLQCGFYGMDMYSLHASMNAVLQYLDNAHPELAQATRERYACFDRFGEDSNVYGMMTGLRGLPGCEEEVIKTLVELRRQARAAGPYDDGEDAFDAEQNARLVKNAEAYYRSMYLSNVSSWNLRDRHMVESLDAIDTRLKKDGVRPRIIVWAHNSHLGDARATEMGRRGELNVGQLMRERHASDAVLIGFTTHTGTVTAASDWGAPTEFKRVVPSREDSVEHVLHSTGLPRFFLPLRDGGLHADALRERRLERAIGVIYRPETERASHYFLAEPADQFDAIVHIDSTRALRPLDHSVEWHSAEVPETFPSGK